MHSVLDGWKRNGTNRGARQTTRLYSRRRSDQLRSRTRRVVWTDSATALWTYNKRTGGIGVRYHRRFDCELHKLERRKNLMTGSHLLPTHSPPTLFIYPNRRLPHSPSYSAANLTRPNKFPHDTRRLRSTLVTLNPPSPNRCFDVRLQQHHGLPGNSSSIRCNTSSSKYSGNCWGWIWAAWAYMADIWRTSESHSAKLWKVTTPHTRNQVMDSSRLPCTQSRGV